ncbi:MAG: ATP-grasp protein [Patescibacteria group bacterium]|nr:ATP-grasp protein [Patescibacteria group bacterium]
MRNCKDCEPAQEIHFIAYMSVVLGAINQPFFDFMEMIFKNTAEAISRKVSVPFFKLMIFLKLGRFSEKPDEKDTWRTKCFWEEANRRGIKMREFHLGPIRDLFVAEFKGQTITFDGLPRPDTSESPALKWMDNKGIMKTKFKKEGLPVAPGGIAFTFHKAKKIFNEIQKPIITKPNIGSRSRHTMIHINTLEDLKIGFYKAKQLSPYVVVEEELRGFLFRGALINGKLIAVMKRDQPEVYGDGIHTVEQLLNKENERPERGGPLFHKITIDHEAEVELKRQNVKMSDIPEKGKIITFSQKTSRGCGGTTTDVTDIIHKDNIEMLEHVGRFLKDPLVGVDFIIEDISKSWKEEQHSGIIECNSLPFIDLHHYPLFGKPRNVAGALWDMVIPESKI